MECAFCNIHKYGEKYFPRDKELSTSQAKLLIYQFSKLGMSIFDLTGGEPLLRNDLVEILTFSKKSGFFNIINTNGTLLDKYLNKKSFIKNIDILRVSVDSVDFHDEIRGTKDKYKKIINNIILARKKGVNVAINSTITRDSLDQMEKLAKLSQKIGCKITFSPVNMFDCPISIKLPQSKGSKNIRKIDPTFFVNMVKKLKGKYRNISNTSFYLDHLEKKDAINKKCEVLKYSINLLPDGCISLPCDAYVVDKLDIKNKDIVKVFKSKKFLDYKRRTGNFDFCLNCDSRCFIFPHSMMKVRRIIDLIMNW